MRELVIDNFSGGGGASLGIMQALGHVDIAINHDEEAIRMHMANHPQTLHLCENIWDVDPLEVSGAQPVGMCWFSPDCTHFSKAKGGRPVKKKIRGLAWVVLRWAGTVRPRVIFLENVEEFRSWGPIRQGRPIKSRKGETFLKFVEQLKSIGYVVEWRELIAANFGAPTSRKRLFLIARCDGDPIVWPEPTHGPGQTKPYRTAGECIDWSIPCPSIFERKRPLAENTLKRIARGLQKFVFDAKEPFIVSPAHSKTTGRGTYEDSLLRPSKTITGTNDKSLIVPFLDKYHGPRTKNDGPRGNAISQRIKTIDTSNRHALVSAFLQRYFGQSVGQKLSNPLPTSTGENKSSLTAVYLSKFYGTSTASGLREPLPTVTGSGLHIAEVSAFLIKYYESNIGQDLRSPLHTVTSKHRLGLITISGQDYQIVDIGLRMLAPRELARGQGFPDSYILTGSKSSQVAKIGNSMCPDMAEILVKSNVILKDVSIAA